MYAHGNATTREDPSTRQAAGRPTARTVTPPSTLLALQAGAGNAAVVQMLRRAGHPMAGHAVQRSTVPDVLSAPGRPLDASTRTEMESRLGADFSDVRLHTGSAARASTAEVGARAYTSGSHVVIGDGGGDKHTLAHELTHVIQQRQGPVSGSDNGAGLRISDPSDRFEREAEANAHRAMSSAPVQRTPQAHQPHQADGPATSTLQRAPAPASASIGEGEVDEVGPGGTITYPSVTSCLVITVHLRDGGKVGGHASLFRVDGKLYSDEILPAVKRVVGKRRVEAVDVSGAVGSWNPSYLTKAIERYTDGAVPEQTHDRAGLGDVVAAVLDRQRNKVTVQDVPDGTLTR